YFICTSSATTEISTLSLHDALPIFFPEGKSTFPDLWNGDANKQIEALWIYLREIDQTRLPVGMEDDTNYELVPADRPILLRTFIDRKSTRLNSSHVKISYAVFCLKK